jgi:hypothetical protein
MIVDRHRGSKGTACGGDINHGRMSRADPGQLDLLTGDMVHANT